MRRKIFTVLAATATIGLAALAAAKASAPIDGAALLADSERPDADRARDADRKPAETMAFAGVRPGIKIAEISPGGGYYTRLLSKAVGPDGRVYAMAVRPSPAVAEWAKGHPNVRFIAIQPGLLNPPEPVDLVWTTNNYHDFKNNRIGASDMAIETNKAAFRALKPGGVYLVADHEAGPGVGATVTSTLHRIESGEVKREVEAAGFVLDGESDILRHPGDDHSLKVQESGIRGKTDQFVLRFRKPRR